MENKIDRIIAKAWLDGCNPKEMLEKEGITLPANFKIPPKPNFILSEETSRNTNTINTSNIHLDSAYCYCG
jgi:hypothetical protein